MTPNNLNIQIDGIGAVSAPLQIVMLLTLISFLPAIIVTMTSFTRIAIVFHFLRQALGTQEMPSNQILLGLALFLTMFIMAPVGQEINAQALEPAMAGNRFYLWIGEHETGRYSKAHKHASAAVLICVKGKGYTYTWPESLGTRPWEAGHGEKVLRQDYEYGGIVSAAPMAGDWFH